MLFPTIIQEIRINILSQPSYNYCVIIQNCKVFVEMIIYANMYISHISVSLV